MLQAWQETVGSAIYPANYRSPRTRANSRELGRTPREFASSSPTPKLRRTPPNVRRSTQNVRRSSAEFARVRPSSRVLRRELANGSPENSFAGRNPNHLQRAFAANEVRRERGSPRTRFAANYVRPWRTAVHRKAYFGWSERSFAAN